MRLDQILRDDLFKSMQRSFTAGRERLRLSATGTDTDKLPRVREVRK